MDNKILSVQYLRGLAALLVVAAHAGAHPLTTEFYLYGRIGQLGVTLFFVISGFIMVAITGARPAEAARFPAPPRHPHRPALLAVYLPCRIARGAGTGHVPLHDVHLAASAAVARLCPHLAPGRIESTSPLLSLGWTLNFEAMFSSPSRSAACSWRGAAS